ncbi:MAG: acyl--CoA ligase [Halioglobus sp.]|nr:acyl--CoA ligase [Halioglobus sp.]
MSRSSTSGGGRGSAVNELAAPAPLLPEILALHGRWQPGKEAVVDGGRRVCWPEFCAASHRFAHGLIARGITRGDRVAVVMSNGFPMVQALFGIMAAGAVSVPINLSVADDSLLAMLRDADVAAVVVTADQQARLERVSASLPGEMRLLITAGDAAQPWIDIDALCHSQPDGLPERNLADDALINIIYSSGTTGLPKGIAHTHRGRRDWAYDLAIALRYDGAARTLLTIGLYSNISWVAMLSTLLCGGTLVIHPRFDAREFLATTRRERITHTAMVPMQFQRVIESLREQPCDVSSMRAMMSCGSPLHEDLKRELFERFPCGIIELYGLTEGIITTLQPEDAEGRWSSVGRPLLGTDLCILGEDDRVLPRGASGEIASRGRIAMPGYWRREDATREATYVDEQGRCWLRSGDIGYVDEQGFLYIVDRKKDMILSGGQNIYPQDIEAVLVRHEAVDDVAVIGLPSVRWGETPVGLVVAKPGVTTETSKLLQWANARLGRQQRLADIILLEQLPRNPNGKILKRELRKLYGEREYD